MSEATRLSSPPLSILCPICKYLTTINASGTYGTVYRCTERATHLELAAKFVKVKLKDERLSMEREIELMSGLHHPRIIQLYDAFDDGKTITCMLEL